MTSHPLNVLFLCTGNSARSILAEAILNKEGGGGFQTFSAGSFPKGEVRPEALRLLENLSHPAENLRSKFWDEFAASSAPEFDLVITVCDNAAEEVCPFWSGQPMTAHWSIPDPAAESSEPEVVLAFGEAYEMLHRRIALLAALPLTTLERQALKHQLDDIGRDADQSEARP